MAHWSAIFTPASSFKKQARLAALLWTLLIFVACLWPGKELPHSSIPLIDKWVHFVMFGGFCFLWLCAFPSIKPGRLLWVLLAGCVTGYLVEVLQGAFPSLGRSKDNMDILADAIGSLLGVLLFYIAARLSVPKRS